MYTHNVGIHEYMKIFEFKMKMNLISMFINKVSLHVYWPIVIISLNYRINVYFDSSNIYYWSSTYSIVQYTYVYSICKCLIKHCTRNEQSKFKFM